jgi:malonyl-CoA/methylmalonyl-CoA synthetase
MRLFVSGSAPLLAETHVSFEARTGHRILERYGMTETNMNTSNPYDGERRRRHRRPPAARGGAAITDPESGAPARGRDRHDRGARPQRFQGYWQMPEKTAEELRPTASSSPAISPASMPTAMSRSSAGQGPDHLGRLQHLPQGGRGWCSTTMPGVLESAVIGVPHPISARASWPCWCPRPGATPDPRRHGRRSMAEALARFKQPKRIVVLDELPRNTMGKVQKNVLRDWGEQ